MSGENTGKIIIPTLAHQMLKSAVDVIAKTAGLGIVTDAPGIGKTFALNAIADDLRGEGVQVVFITVSPEIEGSIRSFCQAVTGYNEGSKYGAADALEASLRGYPFKGSPSPLVFIVDETQSLKPNIMELIRSIWDRGDKARLYDRSAPAFGALLCGNKEFISRGRKAKMAEFGPLRDRITLRVALPNPGANEFAAPAEAMLPDNPPAQAALVKGGQNEGTLRAVEKAFHLAGILAAGAGIQAEHIQAAFSMRGA